MGDSTQVAVIGAGAAGLYAALVAADSGAEVYLVSRKRLSEVSSFWAQGGLAAVLSPEDSLDSHIKDTHEAGRELCRASAVEALVHEAPSALSDIRARGMKFDLQADGQLALSLEGGHSHRRVVHAGGSATGSHLLWWLSALVAEHPRITVWEGASAWSLWSDGECCIGVNTDQGPLRACATILATGGAAALWRRSSNPWGSIGAGAILAHMAGAELADLEFCQFHPTALVLPDHPRDGFLITEAIRGEGARLLNAQGEQFIQELAPRDEVSTAIIDLMREESSNCAWLDMRNVDAGKFPNIVAVLRDVGINPEQDFIPVAPAAHYVMGGIVSDTQGATTLPGLFAIGECSTTGLHGANRLASNSLSECFVFGARAGRAAANTELSAKDLPLRSWSFIPPSARTRDRVWQAAGPERNQKGLTELADDPYPLARMIGASAIARQESRGGHQRNDAPKTDPSLDRVHLIIDKDGALRQETW